MYSLVVSGSDASSKSFTTSMNGTCAMAARNRSGRMFKTAPTSMPPALAPWVATLPFEVYFCSMRYSAEAMKSVKVLIFFIIRPASRHSSPSSPPPRTCAMA
jgi:hypothetical protein